jgi:SnoaL-like domain
VDLHDKLAITETVYKYAYGVDTRDWALYRSIFAEHVAIDFSSYNASRAPRTMAADEWVAGLRPLFTGLAATQHSMSNPIVHLDGDHARITMYMQAHHVFQPDDPVSWYTIGGYYDDTLTFTAGRWQITGVTLKVTWRAGDPKIMDAARDVGLAKIAKSG